MSDVTLPLVVGTIAVVGVGTVVTEHKINGKAILAAGVLSLGLSALDNVNTKMAEMFAAMVFLTACYKFVPPLIESLGFAGGKSGNTVALGAQGSTATPQQSGGIAQ